MRLLVSLLASACLWGGDPQTLLHLADPGAQALLGVEWAQIAHSPYISQARAKFDGELNSLKGLEILEGIDRLVLSAAPRRDGQGTSILILAEGRFDLQKLHEAIRGRNATEQRYRGVELFKAPAGSGEEMDLALLSNRVILAGDRVSLLAAIERDQAVLATGPESSLYRRAIALAAKSDVWGVASPGILSPMGLKELTSQVRTVSKGDPVAAQFLKALSGIEAGGPIEFGFRLDELRKPTPGLAFAPAPAGKRKIRIYGLDEGVKEVDFKD